MKFRSILTITIYMCFINKMICSVNIQTSEPNAEDLNYIQLKFSMLIAFLSVSLGFLLMAMIVAFLLLSQK